MLINNKDANNQLSIDQYVYSAKRKKKICFYCISIVSTLLIRGLIRENLY